MISAVTKPRCRVEMRPCTIDMVICGNHDNDDLLTFIRSLIKQGRMLHLSGRDVEPGALSLYVPACPTELPRREVHLEYLAPVLVPVTADDFLMPVRAALQAWTAGIEMQRERCEDDGPMYGLEDE